MTRWLSAAEDTAWRAYIEGSLRLNARIDADLQASAGLTTADYQVLVFLSEAPQGRLRLHELADRLAFSPSRLTYQLARMERKGLVGREPCLDDRRGSYALITAKGRELLGRAAEAHVASVRAHLLDLLDPEEIRQLGRSFSRIRAHLDPPSHDPSPVARVAVSAAPSERHG
jgi:DNA-binding MarR family transcriptional regulator